MGYSKIDPRQAKETVWRLTGQDGGRYLVGWHASKPLYAIVSGDDFWRLFPNSDEWEQSGVRIVLLEEARRRIIAVHANIPPGTAYFVTPNHSWKLAFGLLSPQDLMRLELEPGLRKGGVVVHWPSGEPVNKWEREPLKLMGTPLSEQIIADRR